MLTIHRAARADALGDALASTLVDPLDDPFTPEVVAVPTHGVDRWLTQRLSTVLGASPGRQDGVCANVEFSFLGRLVGTALATTTGVDPNTDPLAARAVGVAAHGGRRRALDKACMSAFVAANPGLARTECPEARPSRATSEEPEVSGSCVNS
jgi:hypothetical protein